MGLDQAVAGQGLDGLILGAVRACVNAFANLRHKNIVLFGVGVLTGYSSPFLSSPTLVGNET